MRENVLIENMLDHRRSKLQGNVETFQHNLFVQIRKPVPRKVKLFAQRNDSQELFPDQQLQYHLGTC